MLHINLGFLLFLSTHEKAEDKATSESHSHREAVIQNGSDIKNRTGAFQIGSLSRVLTICRKRVTPGKNTIVFSVAHFS